jgi:hypothetical protein
MSKCQRCDENTEWVASGRYGKKVQVNYGTRTEHICKDIARAFEISVIEQSRWERATGKWAVNDEHFPTYDERFDFRLVWRWTSLQQKQQSQQTGPS